MLLVQQKNADVYMADNEQCLLKWRFWSKCDFNCPFNCNHDERKPTIWRRFGYL